MKRTSTFQLPLILAFSTNLYFRALSEVYSSPSNLIPLSENNCSFFLGIKFNFTISSETDRKSPALFFIPQFHSFIGIGSISTSIIVSSRLYCFIQLLL